LLKKKAELAAKKAAQEEELKRAMVKMKNEGKSVDEIKAFVTAEKKRWQAEAAGSTGSRLYTIEELRRKPKECDQTKLETYLSDADFLKIFKMTKAQFHDQKPWKKDALKKEQGIFA